MKETARVLVLNQKSARDFGKRLPFICSGYDSGIDYCCSAANGL